MPTTPITNADLASLIESHKKRIPERFLSQTAIPLNFPRLIDLTLLSPAVKSEEIDALCTTAREHNFASVCVRTEHVARAVANLKNSPNTVVVGVIAFPGGTQDTVEKVREAKDAVSQGAKEIEMAINYQLLKSGDFKAVFDDIDAVRKAVAPSVKLKTIVECSQLDKNQVIAATVVCCEAKADFVQTNIGASQSGPCVEFVTTMRLIAELCFDNCKVKASGEIHSAIDCLRMVKAGATRIGTNVGVNIIKELDEGDLLEQGERHVTA